MVFSPTQLAEIDTVDVTDLERVHADRVSEFMQNAGDAPHVPITDDLAQRIADLWRKLPPGEQARCHVPPFGLRFYRSGELQLQASICWACNNIFGDVKGNSLWYAFDAQHETSQELLALCKQVFESG
jgi:hypothetical protein